MAVFKFGLSADFDPEAVGRDILSKLDFELQRNLSTEIVTNVLSEYTPVHSGTTLGAYRLRLETNQGKTSYRRFPRPREEGTNFLPIGSENQRSEAITEFKRRFRYPKNFIRKGARLKLENLHETKNGLNVVDGLDSGQLPDLPDMHKRGRGMSAKIETGMEQLFLRLLQRLAVTANDLNITVE